MTYCLSKATQVAGAPYGNTVDGSTFVMTCLEKALILLCLNSGGAREITALVDFANRTDISYASTDKNVARKPLLDLTVIAKGKAFWCESLLSLIHIVPQWIYNMVGVGSE